MAEEDEADEKEGLGGKYVDLDEPWEPEFSV